MYQVRLTEIPPPPSHCPLYVRITGASLDLVRTAKLVLEEYFSLGDTVNDMNKILLKDTKPAHRPTFSLGPPDPGPGASKLSISGGTRSAFEVSPDNCSESDREIYYFFCSEQSVGGVETRRDPQLECSQGPEVENFNLSKPEISYSR